MALFSQIHEIVFHGQGGYDYETIYNMPIWLRKFSISKINEHNKEQNDEIEKSKKGSTPNKNQVYRPNVSPGNTYNF